jgi:hypothetical protein
VFGDQFLAGRGRPVQPQVGVALAAAFEVADARVGLAGDRLAPHVGGADRQRRPAPSGPSACTRRPVAVAATGPCAARAFGHRTQAPALAPGARVITLTTPPSASAPYSTDIGPRMTSMRSMSSTAIQSYW